MLTFCWYNGLYISGKISRSTPGLQCQMRIVWLGSMQENKVKTRFCFLRGRGSKLVASGDNQLETELKYDTV